MPRCQMRWPGKSLKKSEVQQSCSVTIQRRVRRREKAMEGGSYGEITHLLGEDPAKGAESGEA